MEIKWGRRLEQQFCVRSAGGDQVEAVVVIAGENDVIAKDLAENDVIAKEKASLPR